jgi:hypothetical protein
MRELQVEKAGITVVESVRRKLLTPPFIIYAINGEMCGQDLRPD